MPNVTFNGKPGSSYTLLFGRVKYFLEGGKPKEVPVAVALHCQKMTDRGGSPLFTVTDLESVIVPENIEPRISGRRVTQLRLIEANQCR